MRRLSIAAVLAVPLLTLITTSRASANPPYNGFGCGDFCLGLFKHIHQHGPLYNYGPYYGYYPFKPYGPWDAYLRYDPFFYGDPYANWQGTQNDAGNTYGRNQNLHSGVHSHGFWHASWLHGGWFRGHSWLHGSSFGLFHKKSCSSCGGVAMAEPAPHTGNVFARYSGVGTAEQSAFFYSATPTLNPVLELVPAAGRTR